MQIKLSVMSISINLEDQRTLLFLTRSLTGTGKKRIQTNLPSHQLKESYFRKVQCLTLCPKKMKMVLRVLAPHLNLEQLILIRINLKNRRKKNNLQKRLKLMNPKNRQNLLLEIKEVANKSNKSLPIMKNLMNLKK